MPRFDSLKEAVVLRKKTRVYVWSSVLSVLSTACIAIGDAHAAPMSCPTFSETTLSEKISKTDRFATFPGGIVARVDTLTIDGDGASTAYHPDNIGTSELCVGLQSYENGKCVPAKGPGYAQCKAAVHKAQAVNWDRARSPTFCIFGFEAGTAKIWGGPAYGQGPLPVQGPTDPAPGFFVSTTPRKLISPKTGKAEYANADLIPFVVASRDTVGKSGITRPLAPAAIVHLADLRSVAAIVGDTGGALGEVSIAAAQLLHDPALTQPTPLTLDQLKSAKNPPYPYKADSDEHLRAVLSPNEGPYLVFLFSGQDGVAKEYSIDETRRVAQAAFSRYGGTAALTKCAASYFDSKK